MRVKSQYPLPSSAASTMRAASRSQLKWRVTRSTSGTRSKLENASGSVCPGPAKAVRKSPAVPLLSGMTPVSCRAELVIMCRRYKPFSLHQPTTNLATPAPREYLLAMLVRLDGAADQEVVSGQTQVQGRLDAGVPLISIIGFAHSNGDLGRGRIVIEDFRNFIPCRSHLGAGRVESPATAL